MRSFLVKSTLIAVCFFTAFSYAAPKTSSKRADGVIKKALEAVRSGDMERAIPLLELAEKKYPFHAANPEVLFQLVNVYADAGRLDEAEKAFDNFMIRYGKYKDSMPQVDELMISKAKILLSQNKNKEAVEYLEDFIKKNPKSKALALAKFQLASAYINTGKSEKAEKFLKPIAAKKRGPMRESAMYLLAEAAMKKGETKEAEKIMQLLSKKAKDRDTKNRALFFLADNYRKSGDIVKAVNAYRRIKAKGTDFESRSLNANILFEIAQTYEQLKHPLEARIGFEGVATLYSDMPLSTEAWHRAVLSDADFGNFDRAEKSYLDFLKKNPGDSTVEDVRLYFSQKLSENNKFKEAIKNLKAGLKEFPTGEWAESSYQALAIAQLGAKQYDGVADTLAKFEKAFPKSKLLPESYFLLAETFVEKENYPKAIETLKKLAGQPELGELSKDAKQRAEELKIAYGDYLAATNKFEEAIEQYESVESEDLLEQAVFLAADANMKMGRYNNAISTLRNFLIDYPDSELVPQAMFSISEAYVEGENYAEAEKMLASIIEKYDSPTNPLLPAAQLQIAFCKYYADDAEGMNNELAALVKKYPDSIEAGDALYWQGYLFRNKTKYEDAAKVYKQLLEKYPSHNYAPEAAYLIGESYALDNKQAQALEGYLNAFNTFPESGYGLYSLMQAGKIYLNKGGLETWLEQLNSLIKENPKRILILIAKAGILAQAGKLEEAEDLLKNIRLQSFNPDAAGYSLALTAALQNKKKEYKKAEQTAGEAAEICSATGVGLDEALFQLAQSLYYQENWEQAETVYAKLLAECLIPDAKMNAEALIRQAECYLKMNQTDGIEELCNKAIQLRPGPELSAQAVLLKADTMIQKGDYQQAARFYKRATIFYGKLDNYGVRAYRGLIDSYKKLGLTQQATEEEEKFKTLYPNEK